jgi:ABC-type branched-subunit amino acid transport system substrate-binding protein/TolA-binding protein
MLSCAPKLIAPTSPADTDKDFAAAERYYRNRAYPKALEHYNRYLKTNPDGENAPAAMLRLAEIHSIFGKYDTARSLCEHMIERFPDSFRVPDAKLRILEITYRENNYREVVRKAESYLKTITSRAHFNKIYVLLGDAYTALGEPANALTAYTRVVEKLHYVEKQRVFERIEKIIRRLSEEELHLLVTRVEVPRVKGDLIFQMGRNRLVEGRIDEARKILNRFVTDYPDHPKAERARTVLKNTKGGRLAAGFNPKEPAIEDGIEAGPTVEPMDVAPIYRFDGGYETQDDSAENTPPMSTPRQPDASLPNSDFVVGCLLPLSGAYETYGNRALRGIELALAEYGEQTGLAPVRITIQDTRSNMNDAVWAVGKLFDEGVSAVIGPIYTAESAAYEAQKYRIPILTLTQKLRIPDAGEYVFRNFLTPRLQIQTLVSHCIHELGIQRFAVLYPNDKYGTTFMDLFWEEVIGYGGAVVGAEAYGEDTTDFTDVIRKMTGQYYQSDSRTASGQPQALFIPDAPEKVGLIVPQLWFHGMEGLQLLGTNLWHSDKLIQMAQKYVQGALIAEGFFAKSQNPNVVDFVRRHQEAYGEDPGYIEAIAFDTTRILLSTANRFGVTTPRELKEMLTKVRRFPGVTGATSFDDRGEVFKQIYLLRIRDDTFVDVNTPE